MKSMSLEELLDTQVVSATKTQQNLGDAPANITVITAKDLRAWGHTTIAEVLDRLLGFYIVDDHVLPNVGVRGVPGSLRSESGIIKVMIDGQSVSYRTTGGNWLGTELVPFSAIERIEIVRGPASALYGADAFMGVVNIILISPSDQLSTEGGGGVNVIGKNVGGDVDLRAARMFGKAELTATARVHQEDRSGLLLPESSPAPHLPNGVERTDPATGLLRRSAVGLLRLGYHFDDTSFVKLTGYFSGLEAGAEFSEWAQLVHREVDGIETGASRLSRTQGGLLLNSRWGVSETFGLSLDGSFLNGRKTERDRLEIGSPSFYVRSASSFRSINLQLGGDWRPVPSVTLVAGLELLVDDEELPTAALVLKSDLRGQAAGTAIDVPRQGPTHQVLVNPGALLQATWQALQSYLAATAGLRYDHHNIYGNQLSGRLGLVSSPAKPLNIKLLYGSAFKAPSPELLYAIPVAAGDVQGNPELRPQYVHTVEGLIGYTPLSWLSISTDVSYSHLLNKAEFLPRGFNSVAQNVARYGSLAWETQLEARYGERLRGLVGFELVRVKRDSGLEGYQARVLGDTDRSYPSMQIKAGIWGKVPIPHVPLQAALTVRYVGARSASGSNTLANGGSYTLPAYVILDGVLSAAELKFLPGETTLELIARNITDSGGVMPGFSGVDYPVTQRSLLFQLRHAL